MVVAASEAPTLNATAGMDALRARRARARWVIFFDSILFFSCKWRGISPRECIIWSLQSVGFSAVASRPRSRDRWLSGSPGVWPSVMSSAVYTP